MSKDIKIEVSTYGTVTYTLDGLYHREDGPAIEYVDGTKYWYLNGKRHREDGPAIEFADSLIDGEKRWCLNDTEMTEEEFLKNKSSKYGNQYCCTSVSVYVSNKITGFKKRRSDKNLSPKIPPGSNWKLVSSSMTDKRIYWFWSK